jgi:LysM repeat protein
MSRSAPRCGAVALAIFALMAVPAGAGAQVLHTVAPGESLSSIAAADGLSIAALAAANGLSDTSQLLDGQTIVIPPQSYAPGAASALAPTAGDAPGAASAATPTAGDAPRALDGDGDHDGDLPASQSPAAGAVAYVVQPGDTLSAIAARAQITVAQLAAFNGLDPNGLLLSGSTLLIPAAGALAQQGAVAASQSAGQGAPTPGSATAAGTVGPPSAGTVGPPYPTPVVMSAGEVGALASGEGVSAALAQAIGWQESGFNNDLVSPAGAVGVMQIEPATWQYVNSVLTPGAPLDPYSAVDNVLAGAMYLHQLIAQTGSVQLGVAAYYQGLSSLQRYGILPSTRQYLRDVLGLQASFGGG